MRAAAAWAGMEDMCRVGMGVGGGLCGGGWNVPATVPTPLATTPVRHARPSPSAALKSGDAAKLETRHETAPPEPPRSQAPAHVRSMP